MLCNQQAIYYVWLKKTWPKTVTTTKIHLTCPRQTFPPIWTIKMNFWSKTPSISNNCHNIEVDVNSRWQLLLKGVEKLEQINCFVILDVCCFCCIADIKRKRLSRLSNELYHLEVPVNLSTPSELERLLMWWKFRLI